MKGAKGFQKGHKHSPETLAKISVSKRANPTRYWLGKKRQDPMYLKKISESHIGQKSWNKGKRGEYTTIRSQEGIDSFREKMSGENHHAWKGGISSTKEYRAYYARLDKLRRRGAIGTFSFQEWEDLKKVYEYMCLCCKRNEPEIKLSVDHVIPISRGGLNTIDNIQPLCHSCNSRKNAKDTDYRLSKVILADYSY